MTAEGAVVRLGRDPTCEVHFDEKQFPKVSGLHAQLEPMGKQLVVRHLSRSNATLVNGKPIEGVSAMGRGDVLRLGFTGPEIVVERILALAAEPTLARNPSPPVAQPASSVIPMPIWAGVCGTAVVVVLIVAFFLKRGDSTAAAPQPQPVPMPVALTETPKAVESKPAIDPKALFRDRCRDAVVSVGFEVDGVFRIVGSGLVVSSDRVATTAIIALFVNEAVKEASKEKSTAGKQVSPAVRLPAGQIRVRRFVVDPKFDPRREHETLLNNLAVGVLERSTSKSVWRDDDECVAAIGSHSDAKPQTVDAVAWQGQGENVFDHLRKEWTGVKVIGADPGSSGEFVAFHLDETFPGSAAGGPVFLDGVWRGLLLRHPAPGEPNRRVWKYVPIDRFPPLLTLGRTEP